MEVHRVDPDLDPTIEQTRVLTSRLFAAALASSQFCFSEPVMAFSALRVGACRAGDRQLVALLDRLDVETFEQTWRELVSVLRYRGSREMLAWLGSHEGT